MSTFEKPNEHAGVGAKIVTDVLITCTLSPEEFRSRKSEHLVMAGKSLQERVERTDGYVFRFPGERFDELAKIVSLERRCCSFLRFTLTSEPGTGPVWLEMTGPAEAKAFLADFWE